MLQKRKEKLHSVNVYLPISTEIESWVSLLTSSPGSVNSWYALMLMILCKWQCTVEKQCLKVMVAFAIGATTVERMGKEFHLI